MSNTPAPSLYAAREPIFPKKVSGTFRRLKWWILWITLGIYYITPWLRWDRGPNLPDQAVLVDLAHRRFFFLWIEIWPHEFYFIAGLLVMAGLGLFLFTSALGRVWCGYACPQTVWTDLFIAVERWIEGDRNARLRLWNAKWSLRKWRLRITKWIVWLMISIATGGAWVFYFADAPTLLGDLVRGNAAFVAYATLGVLTATTFVFGGFMREQICIYMCPWPRIQAAMVDQETLTVAYRPWRGEPRGKLNRPHTEAPHTETPKNGPISLAGGVVALDMGGLDTTTGATTTDGPAPDRQGDCIDCMACVNVCPMGIDIRDGAQMECITCALCIDACDEIMDKVGKPRGLIGYLAYSDEERERAGHKPRPAIKHLLRPRTMMYTALWSLVGFGLVFALFIRSEIDITVAPARNPTFVTLSDGSIRNAFDLRIRNKHGENRDFHISLTADTPMHISLEGTDELTITVAADSLYLQRVYVKVPANSAPALAEHTDLRLWVEDLGNNDSTYKDTVFSGKGN